MSDRSSFVVDFGFFFLVIWSTSDFIDFKYFILLNILEYLRWFYVLSYFIVCESKNVELLLMC